MKKLTLLALIILPSAAWAQAVLVPEPETLPLFVIGAAAFFLTRKVRK